MTPETRKTIERINSSVEFDHRLAELDVACTRAHVEMLGATGLLPKEEVGALTAALDRVADMIRAGTLAFRADLEDVHSNIERAVAQESGSGSQWMARARNDHAVAIFRLWIRDSMDRLANGWFA